MTGKLRSEMTPEELVVARRKWKYWRVMQQRGMPCNVTPDEMDRVRRHVDILSAQGMSMRDIALAAGVYENAPGRVHTGLAKALRRETYERLLTVQCGAGSERCLVNDKGAVRRVQALIADGYTYKFLTLAVGMHSNSGMCKIAHGSGSMLNVTARNIRTMYDKYAGANPFDTGVSRKSHTQAKRTAASHGWAPSHCWDWDTIDNIDAIPEWTGRCGTMAGYRLHVSHGIPVCNPCREAKGWARR